MSKARSLTCTNVGRIVAKSRRYRYSRGSSSLVQSYPLLLALIEFREAHLVTFQYSLLPSFPLFVCRRIESYYAGSNRRVLTGDRIQLPL